MNLNNDDLENITAMSGLFLTPSEIAINLNVDESEFIEQINIPGYDVKRAYDTGIILGKIKLRTGIMIAAEHGSSPAQQLMLQLLHESEVKRKIDE
jgi:hypothetical protein